MTVRKLLTCFLLAAVSSVAYSMTDDEVVSYVKNGLASGKSEQQIGKELLAKGVTQQQIERLKTKYEESQGEEIKVESMSVAGQRAERLHVSGEDITAGRLDDLSRAASEPQAKVSNGVFGHDVFSSRALTFEPNENLPTPQNYRLGPGDEVIIDIWGTNEAQVREVISPEGVIMVSQIGPVYLNGLTIKEADSKMRQVFASKYAGVMGDNPESDINVTLGRIRTIQVDILGEVSVPGTYRLSPFSSVFHALYKAGGITDIGSLRDITVMRNGRKLREIDVYDYLFNGNQESNIRLEEGDLILVSPYEELVKIDGNVKRPMRYELRNNETLADLLEYAGGFTGGAYGDQVRISRQTGLENEIFIVPSEEFATYRMADGDIVTIGAVLDRYSNRVEIRGSVLRPGMFAIDNDTRTVKNLVEKAAGPTEDAFLDRVQLFREGPGKNLEVIALNLGAILDGTAPDIELQRNDVLVVTSEHEIWDRGHISVDGQVGRPGWYPYAANTTIEDIIIQAGGLLDGASTARIDVSRRISDPSALTPTNELAQTYTFALKDGFVIDGEPGFVLKPYDIVNVRKSPGYRNQREVWIDGEVVFEGKYSLRKKNERLSDLVRYAGGITSDAYLKGAHLLRQMNEDEVYARDQTIRLATANQEGGDSISMDKLQLSNVYSVGIDLEKALANPGSDFDMVLREGDRLVVPQYVSTVKISGDVMYPNTALYQKDKKLKYYIEQAGGYGERAKKSKAFVVYMNGTVARAKGNVKIEPGCEIIVPSKPNKKGVTFAEIMGILTSTASIGTMAASIANLVK